MISPPKIQGRRPRYPKWKSGQVFPPVLKRMLIGGAIAGIAAFGWAMTRTKAAPTYHWVQNQAPRVCDANHDGIEDFVGDIAYDDGVAHATLFDGKTLAPSCNSRFPGCTESCVTVAEPKRTYVVGTEAFVITEGGAILKQIPR